MDGLLDWYLLGVILGLGVVAGTAGVGARRTVYGLVSAAAVAAAVALVALSSLPWWPLFAFAGVSLVAGLALRKLSLDALPAALLVGVVLAVVPALGYLAVVAVPVVGARLGHRADRRYAGLRVLAKD
jgi:hypothetical protein